MSEAIVVDSYAWVEYAAGTEAGRQARHYIEGTEMLYTPSVVIAELSDRATRTDRRSQWETSLWPFISRHTTIVPLDEPLPNRAGELKWEMRNSSPQAGLADAIVLATAREHDARVLTGDPDFLVPAFEDEVIDITVEEDAVP